MKQLKIIFLMAIFFLAGYILGQGYQPFPTINKSSAPTSDTIIQPEGVSFMFVFDQQSILTTDLVWQENLNLASATEIVVRANELEYTAEDYGDLGILISQIGDKLNGDGNAYWQYWVNNQQAQIAANDYIISPGDVISWQFRESEF
jgi:hypothetical protein